MKIKFIVKQVTDRAAAIAAMRKRYPGESVVAVAKMVKVGVALPAQEHFQLYLFLTEEYVHNHFAGEIPTAVVLLTAEVKGYTKWSENVPGLEIETVCEFSTAELQRAQEVVDEFAKLHSANKWFSTLPDTMQAYVRTLIKNSVPCG